MPEDRMIVETDCAIPRARADARQPQRAGLCVDMARQLAEIARR